MIVRVSVVLKRTVGDSEVTLKITTAQLVETPVTVTNSSFQNYTHPDNHTMYTNSIVLFCLVLTIILANFD